MQNELKQSVIDFIYIINIFEAYTNNLDNDDKKRQAKFIKNMFIGHAEICFHEGLSLDDLNDCLKNAGIVDKKFIFNKYGLQFI